MLKQFSILFLALVSLASCHFLHSERIEGSGKVTTETRQTSNFSAIQVSGALHVYITQDSGFRVSVETDDNVQAYIITEVRGDGVLHIKQEDNTSLETTALKVYVSAPLYKKLGVSGASKISGQNKLSSNAAVLLDLSGASSLIADIDAPIIDVELSGASAAELSGSTKQLAINGSGSSDIKCFGLAAEIVLIDISGAGEAEVSASAKLDVEVSGAASIKYKGNPSVSEDVSGAGSVKRVD